MRTCVLLIALAGAALAQPTARTGTDEFHAGASVSERLEAPGDVFATGGTVATRGSAAQDLHAAGFSVEVEGAVGGDVYAAGASVTVRADVAEDATLVGGAVRLADGARIGGNVRVSGGVVTLEGAVEGAVTAAAGSLRLAGEIGGDARLVGGQIAVDPDARIAGTLTYAAPARIDIPEAVIPAARIRFEQLDPQRLGSGWTEAMGPGRGGGIAGILVGGAAVTVLFFVVLGALFLTLLPRTTERLRTSVEARPWRIVLIGVIGLSMLFGAVPIVALTVVGLPLVPILLLGIVLAWTLGYALGAYAVGMRLWRGFGGRPEPGIGLRLLVLGAAVLVVALLNFIPFLGWVANYTLVLVGLGAMTFAVFEALVGSAGPALDADMQPLEG